MLSRGRHVSPRPRSRKTRLIGRAVPLGLALVTAMGAVALAHDFSVPTATISPDSGTVITEQTTVLSGTFGPSGCGLDGDITLVAVLQPDAGTVVMDPGYPQCAGEGDDGIWTWQATWMDYGEGTHTITASFSSSSHGGPNDFKHTGEVSATYVVVASDNCEGGYNHGQYVSCVAKDTPSQPGKGQIVSVAARDK